MRIGLIISALMWWGIVSILSGCTIKIDNPFYSPSSIDVNKIESKAVNNYKGE